MEKEKIVEENILESKKKIKEKILVDNLIVFISRVLEDLTKQENPKIFGRAKELYLSINPYSNYGGYQMLDFLKRDFKCENGMSLDEEERHFVRVIFNELNDDFEFKNPKVMKGRLKGILNKLCEKYLPMSSKIVEPQIICRIISASRGITRLKNLPSSTIQLIGAEEALFRHLATKSRSPKYGLLYYSKYIQQEKEKGKAARQIANKLAISIKVDYFQKISPTSQITFSGT